MPEHIGHDCRALNSNQNDRSDELCHTTYY